ncbi:MAG: pseudouridine synthase family protein [Lachnospirales bacterium]
MKILSEDNDYVCIEKSQKEFVQHSKNAKSQIQEFADLNKYHIANRLDFAVGGIVILCKNKTSIKEFQNSLNKKLYLCIVDSVIAVNCCHGTLENFILKNQRTNTSKIVQKGTTGSKNAKLNYRVIEVKGNLALLEIELFTGRHHQIRVQMSNFGFPIYGDKKYTGTKGKELGLWSYKYEFFSGKSFRSIPNFYPFNLFNMHNPEL